MPYGVSWSCWVFNTYCPTPTPLFDYPLGHLFFYMIAVSNIFVLTLHTALRQLVRRRQTSLRK